MAALSYLEKMMETVEILVMNLAFQDLVGTPHQELERKTSVMVDNKTLTYEIAKLRHRVWLLESNIDKIFERSGDTMTPIQISDGKEYIERRELTKMFIPAILVSLASFIAFTTSLYQIFRANQRVRYIYSNFTGD
ncbi:unnamed protein product [Bathycoccus prasinos]